MREIYGFLQLASRLASPFGQGFMLALMLILASYV